MKKSYIEREKFPTIFWSTWLFISLIFIVLKLFNVIKWSWWIVLSPIWELGTILLLLVILLIILAYLNDYPDEF